MSQDKFYYEIHVDYVNELTHDEWDEQFNFDK